MDLLKIGDYEFNTRLLLGTGKYSSIDIMIETVKAVKPALITVALKRVNIDNPDEDIFIALQNIEDIILMPNTAGAKTAEEAYKLAHIGKELSGERFVKIEIHPDTEYLLPDAIETFNVCKKLTREGFYVMPYINADLVLARRLEEIGCVSVMPLAAPIGSGRGLLTYEFIQMITDKLNIPVIVDAGLKSPSEAAAAMELGAAAILVNTAVALSENPIAMAKAFDMAVTAGRKAYKAGIIDTVSHARASSPNLDFLL